MRDKELDYEHAHAIASQVEYDFRESGEASQVLDLGERRLAQRDLPRLTSSLYFEFVVNRFLKKQRKKS
jgi:hypothetical protein